MYITDWLAFEIEAKSWYAKAGLSSSIVFLFLCLYTVSDRHLTVALRHIAKGLHMPADLAGMTLLAFGNGAPDFFTAVFGASEAPEMILSGAVGAALFTFTIVFGLVMILQTTPTLVLSPVQEDFTRGLTREPSDHVSHSSYILPFPFFRNTLLCMFCSSALFFFLWVGTIKYWMALVLISAYICNLSASIISHLISGQPDPEIPPAWDKGSYSTIFWSLSPLQRISFLWTNIGWSPVTGSLPVQSITILARIIRLPMSMILNISVLPVKYPDTEQATSDWDMALFVVNRMKFLTAPFFSILLFGFIFIPNVHSAIFWLLIPSLSIISSLGLWYTSSWNGKPKLFLLHAIYAFITCLGFIYLISRELISCLRSLGDVARVSSSTMGVLVLAWGNSFGDLVADTTMSRTGHLNMALFGVFAAHIQNVLFTLGTAFLLATLQTQSRSLDVKGIDPKVYIGLLIVGTVLILSLTLVPTLGKFTLPRWCGFILLSFYALFAGFALLLEFQVIRL